MTDWPFDDPPNVAVFTSRRIVSGDDFVHYVAHDSDDGAWQFHPFSGLTPEGEATVVSLRTMVEIDPTIAALADLPIGWHAWRSTRFDDWERAINDDDSG